MILAIRDGVRDELFNSTSAFDARMWTAIGERRELISLGWTAQGVAIRNVVMDEIWSPWALDGEEER